MDGYTSVDDENNPNKGDYLKYMDEWGRVVGCGVMVCKVVNPVYPRTKSYYVLKNIHSRATWKVCCRRYTFYFKPVQNGATARNNQLRALLLGMVNQNI